MLKEEAKKEQQCQEGRTLTKEETETRREEKQQE